MNRHDELHALRRRKPFVPFRFKLSDGRLIEVNDPLMFGFNEIIVLVAKENGGTVTFRYEEIVSIDDLPPTAGATTDTIAKLHRNRPFRPFAIRFGDGHTLPVEQPEMLAYAPKQSTAVVFRDDGTFEMVDLSLVTGFEVASE